MSDTLTMSDLEVWTRIGVTEEERKAEQRILVTIELSLDTREAAAGDNVGRSIAYDSVAEAVRKLMAEERHTIEHLAEDVATMILRTYKPDAVAVTVTKFALPGASSVSLTVRRP
jgi:FolB domain-containing protein